MPVSSAWFVLIALAAAFLLTQQYFFATYRRRHNVEWRPFRRRMLTGPNAKERSEMRGATFRRDEDGAVELSRRLYLAAFAVVIVVGLVLLVSGSLLPR